MDILGSDNDCADAVLCLEKDNLISITKLFQRYLTLSTYRHYYLALELILVHFNALLNNSQEVPIQLRFKEHF